MARDRPFLVNIQYDYTDTGFEDLYLKLDLLHGLASAGRLAEVTTIPLDQVRGWLKEYIFIARETLHELEGL